MPIAADRQDPRVLDGFKTCGNWLTENESAAAFDERIRNSNLFFNFEEVHGRYLSLRPDQEVKTARIDRVLHPTPALIEAGWDLGPVGVECKRSNVKTGPPINQLIDYSHAMFKLNHTWVVPRWHFLWPMMPVKGPLESVFAHQRIGGIFIDNRNNLAFHSRGTIAVISPPGKLDYRPGNTVAGTKTGSR